MDKGSVRVIEWVGGPRDTELVEVGVVFGLWKKSLIGSRDQPSVEKCRASTFRFVPPEHRCLSPSSQTEGPITGGPCLCLSCVAKYSVSIIGETIN